MTPQDVISNFVLLPELKLDFVRVEGRARHVYYCTKRSGFEVCPRCAVKCTGVYDRRKVRIKDIPLRDKRIVLLITKRRFYCRSCKLPFTEPVPGIKKGRRTTQRFRSSLLWAADHYTDLKKVKKHFDCSNDLLYRSLYESLELKRRTRLYPWPKTIGIDEHRFKKARNKAKCDFVTMVVDYSNKRLMEVVDGRAKDRLYDGLHSIEGRNNVTHAVMDLADPYKSFVREFFPRANIVADKFHVLRLVNPTLNKYRKAVAGDRRSNPIGWLLNKSRIKLDYKTRWIVDKWLDEHPSVRELYWAKEALHRLYRVRGYNKARRALIKLTDTLAHSKIPEIKTLRRTLLKWKNEILNYFKTRLTNARTEAYNNVAKLVKRRAYGFRNFNNYRLRLLNACS